MCRTLFGWNGEKNEFGRTLLQEVGTNVVRAKAPDFWVDFAISVLKFFPAEWDYIIIPDCRFKNEIYRLVEAGFQTIHIRVERPNFESPLTPEQQNHPSEKDLDDVSPDILLGNTGTIADLEMVISKKLSSIGDFQQLKIEEIL